MSRYELMRREYEQKRARVGMSGIGPGSLNGGPGAVRRMRVAALLLGAVALLLIGSIVLVRGLPGAGCSAGRSGMIGSGTGFFVTPDGLLVTAAHVVENARDIAVKTDSGFWPAAVLRVDRANDLAILQVVTATPVPFLALGDSTRARLGTGVFTIGFPNIQLQGVGPKITRGEISSLAGIQDDPRLFQISVPVQPGNSGGPLVDLQGNVVGVVVARLDDQAALSVSGALPQNVNYAIKMNYLRSLFDSLPAGAGVPGRPAAGARTFEETIENVRSAVALVLVKTD